MIRQLVSEVTRERFSEYINGITRNLHLGFRAVFTMKYMVLHLLGTILTLLILFLEIDWRYFLFFKDHIWFQIFFIFAPPLGGLIPILFPAGIFLYGKKNKKRYFYPLAFVMTQAGLVALFWSSIYKAITGRTGPELFEDHPRNYSGEFAIGFMRKGVFDGWPSGHASIS